MTHQDSWKLIFCFRKHIEVHGRPTPAVFRSSPNAGGRSTYQLLWTVDSYSPIQEYRLLYRQIQPYHKVGFCRESHFNFSFLLSSSLNGSKSQNFSSKKESLISPLCVQKPKTFCWTKDMKRACNKIKVTFVPLLLSNLTLIMAFEYKSSVAKFTLNIVKHSGEKFLDMGLRLRP